MSKLSHIDQKGEARMVDVSGKETTVRTATAEGYVVMAPATLALLQSGAAPKGDVLATARIAGIMAAKRTSELIPLCHPLNLSKVAVRFDTEPRSSRCPRHSRGQDGRADRRGDGGAHGRVGRLPHAL